VTNLYRVRPVARRAVDYEALLKELYGLERFGIKLGLDVIRDLLHRLEDPHESFPAIHVTGTNGKGSVCAYLASIFRAAGHRVGLYTSPHLVTFNERIRVDDRVRPDTRYGLSKAFGEALGSLYADKYGLGVRLPSLPDRSTQPDADSQPRARSGHRGESPGRRLPLSTAG